MKMILKKLKKLINIFYPKNISKHIEIHCISKINYFNEVEILKCFYCSIINQLKIKEGIIFSSILTAGLEIKAFNNDIKSLLLLSYNSSESHNIIVPLTISPGAKHVFPMSTVIEIVDSKLYCWSVSKSYPIYI